LIDNQTFFTGKLGITEIWPELIFSTHTRGVARKNISVFTENESSVYFCPARYVHWGFSPGAHLGGFGLLKN